MTNTDTVKVANLSDVVFGTNGSYKTLADFYKAVRDARLAHFERLLTAQGRLIHTQRLLDEKPDQLFVQDGKAKLTQLRDDLKDVTEEIRAENSAYTKLDPKGVKVSLDAGQIIPTISPVQYFKQPYVKVAEWVRTSGQAVQCGWSSYKDCEFHDFYVQFYPKLQFVLPEFVQRIRLLQATGGNCVPLTTARSNDIQAILKDGGNFGSFYQSSHVAIKAYTWGTHHMPGAFTGWKNAVGATETQKVYILEVTATDESVHYVDLGAYGKSVDPSKEVVAYDAVCGT